MTQPKDQQMLPENATEAAQEWFLTLNSGMATQTDLRRFEAWRDAAPDHRAAFEEVRELWNDVGELRTTFAPREPDTGGRAADAVRGVSPLRADDRRTGEPRFGERRVEDRCLGELRAPSRRNIAKRPARRQGAAGRRLAAGGLIAACLALLAVFATDLRTGFLADFHTAAGEQTRIALPDGSSAHLNSDSAIVLDFDARHRRVRLLRGEAFFEVAKDPGRPFEVLALEGRSTAIGTAFSLRDLGEDAVVTVMEGRVRVDAAGSSVALTADQQVRYRRGGAPGTVTSVDAASESAWRRGLILIDSLPLADALAEIDRYHPGMILLLGGTMDSEPVTARIALRKIDSGLEALAATHGLSVTRITDYFTIVR